MKLTGWRTSSYTGNGGDTCVDAASNGEIIAIRDSSDNGYGLTLSFTPDAWTAFTASLR